MTLAARCPACGTVFRVVQDQLRVSEGWVRCGRCAEVFNAIDGLVELDADAEARPLSRTPGRERVLEDLARVTQSEAPPIEASRSATVAALASAETAAPAAIHSIHDSFDDSEFRAEPGTRPAEPGARPARGTAPEFVRRAERAARWRRPGVRIALSLFALVASVILFAQIAIEYRDLVAARWPESRAFLAPACATLGCRIEAPRAIDSLVVESSGLVRIEGSSNYRLSVVLRNRAPLSLAVPALDLTLTDSQGAVIARRVIGLNELGVRQQSVSGGAELPLQTLIAAADRPISGYTIEVFYP